MTVETDDMPKALFVNYDEPYITPESPETALLFNVLDRAIRDLDSPENHVRATTQQWFIKEESLLPFGVGYGDILDLHRLTSVRVQQIRQMVRRSQHNEPARLAFEFRPHRRRVR